MSFQPENNPYLKQIYDTMLDKAILDVQVAYSSGNPDLFESALKKLMVMIQEPDERAKQKQFQENIQRMVKMEKGQDTYGLVERYFQSVRVNQFRMDKGLELFGLILSGLNAKGYLKNSGVIGRNPNPRHIRQESEEKKHE